MQYPVRTRQWTRAEYDRLIEIGIFRPGDPVELLGGDLVVAEPQSGPHYTAIYLAEEALRRVFGPGWLVRTQAPIALDDESEPEPDVAVAQGPPREFSREHPARPIRSSRSPSPACRSTGTTRAASTPARSCKTTGS
jgi:hypothetical protein